MSCGRAVHIIKSGIDQNYPMRLDLTSACKAKKVGSNKFISIMVTLVKKKKIALMIFSSLYRGKLKMMSQLLRRLATWKETN